MMRIVGKKSSGIDGYNRRVRPLGRANILLLLTYLVTISAYGEENVRFTQGEVNESATLSVGVPLASYKGRGINLPVSLSYSSTVWNIEHLGKVRTPGGAPQSVTEAIYAKHSTSGWRSSLDLPKLEFPKATDTYSYNGKPGSACGAFRIAKVFIHVPDGSSHELRKSDYPYAAANVDMTGTFYAVDGMPPAPIPARFTYRTELVMS